MRKSDKADCSCEHKLSWFIIFQQGRIEWTSTTLLPNVITSDFTLACSSDTNIDDVRTICHEAVCINLSLLSICPEEYGLMFLYIFICCIPQLSENMHYATTPCWGPVNLWNILQFVQVGCGVQPMIFKILSTLLKYNLFKQPLLKSFYFEIKRCSGVFVCNHSSSFMFMGWQNI